MELAGHSELQGDEGQDQGGHLDQHGEEEEQSNISKSSEIDSYIF